MSPEAIILTVITILTTHLFTAPLSDSDSVFGIHSGIMASWDPIIGDIRLTTGDTLPIIGEEVTIRTMDAVAIILTVPPTGPISGKTS